MPEGDTVHLAARRMHALFAGTVLRRSDFRVPQLATSDLSGRTVLEVVPRGKHMLTRLEGGLTVHTHFGMEGTWRIHRRGQRWGGGPAFQIRIVLGNDTHDAVGYRMKAVGLVRTADESTIVGHLGPDVLGPDWDEAEALRRLRAEGDREVGDALVDQRVIAGPGNLYRCEALFLRGVTPWTPVRDVPDLAALVRVVREIMLANRDRWEQTTTGNTRRGEEHWVHAREGRPCRRCGSRILMAMQGPPLQQRATYWCRHCQQGPAPPPLPRAARAPAPAGWRRYRG